MSDMSKSVSYFFVIVLAIYFIGIAIYTAVVKLKSFKERRRNG